LGTHVGAKHAIVKDLASGLSGGVKNGDGNQAGRAFGRADTGFDELLKCGDEISGNLGTEIE
jgi:hypothetical protein